MKVLIAILGCKFHYFNEVENASKNTWIKHLESNQTHLFYYGNSKETIYDNNELFLPVKEKPNVLMKTLSCFKFCLDNFDFDFLYRPCNGSFIIPSKLNSYIESLSKDEFIFNGVVGNFKPLNSKFISGAGMLFNHNALCKLMDYNFTNDFYPDDVSISNAMKTFGINFTNAPRVDVYEDLDKDSNFKKCDKQLHHHYHLRNKPNLMQQLNDFFFEVKTC